jgi:hypothetical protein
MDWTAGKAAYQAVASTLGLTLSMPEPTDPQPRFALWGALDGFALDHQRYGFGGRSASTEAILRAPLDLGLLVGYRGVGVYRAQQRGLVAAPTGDGTFDARFTTWADGPDRARLLLTDAVRACALAIAARGRTVRIHDHGVQVVRRGVETDDADELAWDLHAAARLAGEVARAAAEVPVRAELAACEAAWRAFVAAHALAFTTCPLAAWGAIPEGHLDVVVYWFGAEIARRERLAAPAELVVRLWFAEPAADVKIGQARVPCVGEAARAAPFHDALSEGVIADGFVSAVRFCVPTAEWLSGLVAYVRATARGALDRWAAAGLGEA